jgi:drug/metabolite transporter superfamily protein YnfA
MRSVSLVLAAANGLDSSTTTGNVLLVMAALLLFVALSLLRQVVQPLREVLRALAAAGGMVLLVALALALVVASLAVPR